MFAQRLGRVIVSVQVSRTISHVPGALAGGKATPMVNAPTSGSAYPGMSGDGSAGEAAKPSWRSRLSRVPVVGRFVTDPEAEAQAERVKEQTKEAAKSLPRRPGVKIPNPTLFIASPNVTVEPYEISKGGEGKAEEKKEEGKGWWARYRESAADASKDTMAVMAIKKEMDGFTTEKFEELAGESYVLINDAFYSDSRSLSTLRRLTTEKVFTQLKREMKLARSPAANPTSHASTNNRSKKSPPASRAFRWSLDEFSVPPKIMQSRAFPLRDDEDVWAQITVKFESLQSLDITDASSGTLISSHPNQEVVEYWVFERRLRAPEDTNWRLCDRLI